MILAVPNSALPSRKLRTSVLSIALAAATISLLFRYLDLSPASFVIEPSYLADVFHQFFPPKPVLDRFISVVDRSARFLRHTSSAR